MASLRISLFSPLLSSPINPPLLPRKLPSPPLCFSFHCDSKPWNPLISRQASAAPRRGLLISFSISSTFRRRISVVLSEESGRTSRTPSMAGDFKLTYLEGNSWLWEVDGVKILVDPILVGNLDFNIPWLYNASKKHLKNLQITDIAPVDIILITQSLDDHCHVKTLTPLSQLIPKVKVLATPNAQSLISPLFTDVIYLEPGEVFSHETGVTIKATAGPVLGPPWQRPENGYLVRSGRGGAMYYEPHCVYDEEGLAGERAEVVITPVIKQLLPGLTLVSGQEDAVRLAKTLQARVVVPMRNGDLDSEGMLAKVIRSEGTVESFIDLLRKEVPEIEVMLPVPGVVLQI